MRFCRPTGYCWCGFSVREVDAESVRRELSRHSSSAAASTSVSVGQSVAGLEAWLSASLQLTARAELRAIVVTAPGSADAVTLGALIDAHHELAASRSPDQVTGRGDGSPGEGESL